MRMLVFVSVLFCMSACTYGLPPLSEWLKSNNESNIYALLVAGSQTWMNYRHQADVCHAYQIFHAHGVPDENIVVMMVDDIAHNEQNPTPGVIINHVNGPNVYPGVPHDYTGEDVTPQNFLNILQGNAAAMSGIGSGKVIRSGPNNYVFVNFVDHGAPGFVAFPNYPQGELTAQQLNQAIQSMHSQNKFKQMVVYIEACESGSMFDGLLPTNTDVYATTAANPDESSYACYYDAKLQTYLGDCYSVNWMENVDNVGTSSETLEQQYEEVKTKTTESHVMQYGDLSIDNELLQVFMGSKNSELPLAIVESSPVASKEAVPVGDVPIAIMMHQIYDTTDYWEKRKYEQRLMEELLLRERVRSTVEEIVHIALGEDSHIKDSILGKPAKPANFDCYTPALQHFSEHCFRLNEVDYALRHVYALSNLCEAGVDMYTILNAIEQAC